jgi:hypothetical protein
MAGAYRPHPRVLACAPGASCDDAVSLCATAAADAGPGARQDVPMTTRLQRLTGGLILVLLVLAPPEETPGRARRLEIPGWPDPQRRPTSNRRNLRNPGNPSPIGRRTGERSYFFAELKDRFFRTSLQCRGLWPCVVDDIDRDRFHRITDSNRR